MRTTWIGTHQLASFFLLTYGITWSLNGLVILLGMEPSWTRWILSGFLTALGPAIAAVVVVHASDRDLREWAHGIVRWRVHPGWYAAAIGIPAGVALASAVVVDLLGGPVDFDAFSPHLLTLAFGIVLGTLVGGGQEEIGWRGFAQPELQERYGGLVAAIAIGVLWGGWHLPLFMDPTAPHSAWPLASQAVYFVGITGFSVLLAWVYNGSGGSILLVMLMHGSENALGALVPLDVDLVLVDGVPDWDILVPLTVSHALLTWAVALVVIALVGRELHAGRVRWTNPAEPETDVPAH